MKRIIILIINLFFVIGCLNVNNKIPDNAYEINDARSNKVDINGKYVSIDNKKAFFEIADGYALISKEFEEYVGYYGEKTFKKVLEITEEGGIRLEFVILEKENDNLPLEINFYSKRDDFVWKQSHIYPGDEQLTFLFKKQN